MGHIKLEKLIPKMIINIFHNKNLPIYAKGQNSREWIHVYDHCEALFRLYLKGKLQLQCRHKQKFKKYRFSKKDFKNL